MEIIAMEDFEKMAYDRARRKAKEIKGFYMNLCCYLVIIPVLIFINLTFSPQFHWFWFSAIGWGIGVISHAIAAFGYYPFLARDWEARKLKELMDKMDSEQKQKSKYE